MQHDLRTAPVRFLDLGHTRLAHRVVGHGPDVVLIHGWPLHSLTWRDVVPRLADRYRCHVIDLPGTGATEWTKATPFGIEAHAQTMTRAIELLGLDRFALIGHDSGAAIGRYVAANLGSRVVANVVSGSEIPNHHPLLLTFLTAKAKEQNYQPEWVITGVALIDNDMIGQILQQDQWGRAFGVSFSGPTQAAGQGLGYRAYKPKRDEAPKNGAPKGAAPKNGA